MKKTSGKTKKIYMARHFYARNGKQKRSTGEGIATIYRMRKKSDKAKPEKISAGKAQKFKPVKPKKKLDGKA